MSLATYLLRPTSSRTAQILVTTTIDLVGFGEQIRAAMRARGIEDAKALAKLVGVSEKRMNAWLKGAGMKVSNLAKLCEVLDRRPDELLGASRMVIEVEVPAGLPPETRALLLAQKIVEVLDRPVKVPKPRRRGAASAAAE